MPEIIINLNESADAKDFKAPDKENDGNLIHVDQFQKVKGWIDERIRKSSIQAEKTESKINTRSHDAITVLGTRGSGKTSFLLSIIRLYEDLKDPVAELAILKIIDPTLIEEKGHVFLSIISCIRTEVEKILNTKDTNPGEKGFGDRKIWQEKLKSLADGLPSMDGVGNDMQHDAWQDPEFIMNKGMRQVASASKLEDNFQDLVSYGLGILGKKCFLVMFDDIDIDFRKGWAVLETVRKYLTSSKIIVILSGDMKLFSLGIRKQQWGNFGKALLINEGQHLQRIAIFNDRVTEMEGQYMQKVLKPEKRVHLTTLYEKLSRNNQDLRIQVLIDGKPKELKIVYNDLLLKLGIANGYQQDAYSSFLLGLPVRTQLQFLSSFYNKSQGSTNITESFLSDLYEKAVDIDMAISSSKFTNIITLKLLLNHKLLEEAYQLQPTTTDVSLNGSLIALSFLFSEQSKNNPYSIFDYFIRIGYTNSLLNTLEYADEEKTISQYSPSIQGLCKQSGIFQDKVLKDIANRMTAYVRGYLNKDGKNEKHWGGIILLQALAKRAKQGKNEMLNSIDRVLDDDSVSEEHRTIGYIPLGICKYLDKNETVVTYSVFVLLASIGELIRKAELNDLQKGLVELSQLRTYPMPDFSKKSLSGNNVSDPEVIATVKVREANTAAIDLPGLLQKWIKDFPKDHAVSPHLLGKMITRFFYALNNIEDEQNFENLGEFVHAQIIAFMNSVLIEDIKENLTDTRGININNTKFDDAIFLANLKKMGSSGGDTEISQKEIGKLIFSGWVLTCPLLLLYLDASVELVNQLSTFWANIRQQHKEAKDQALTSYNEDAKYVGVILNKSVSFLLKKVSIKNTQPRINADQTIRLRKDYELLIQTLKDKGVPYNLFDPKNMDRKITKNNNEVIRKDYSGLFKDTTSAALRGFREYLAKDPSRSW